MAYFLYLTRDKISQIRQSNQTLKDELVTTSQLSNLFTFIGRRKNIGKSSQQAERTKNQEPISRWEQLCTKNRNRDKKTRRS